MTHRLLGAFLGVALLGAPGLATRCVAKPPDLPENQKITVLPAEDPTQGVWVDLNESEIPVPAKRVACPQTEGCPHQGMWCGPDPVKVPYPIRESEAPSRKAYRKAKRINLLTAFVFMAHPIVCLMDEGTPDAPCEPAKPTSAGCPYKPKKACPEPEVMAGRSVLDNLDRLMKAGERLEAAKALLSEGKIYEGVACLEEVRALCPGSSYEERVNEVMSALFAGQYATNDFEGSAEEEASDQDDSCTTPILEQETAQFAVDRCRKSEVDIYLDTRITLEYTNVPLQVVLDDLRGCQCVPVIIDVESMQKIGVLPSTPVTIKADGIPLRLAIDLVCRPLHLSCKVEGDRVVIMGAERKHGEEQCEEPAPGQAACPKAEALHEQHCAAVKVMVDGLMKACHLALGEGRIEKAAELARQAHALDPERVEADPVAYKLHLLDMPVPQEPKQTPLETSCPSSESIQPSLPPVDPGVVTALDEVLRRCEGVASTQANSSRCPIAIAAEQMRHWLEDATHGNGALTFGVGFSGLHVSVKAAVNGTVTRLEVSSRGLTVASEPDPAVEQADSER